VGGQKLVTHLLPSGVMHPGARCVLGAGVVVGAGDPADEIAACEAIGLGVRDRGW
jgi:adenylosuccinate synthase